jgi:uroporphyrinogen-III decarboxylase
MDYSIVFLPETITEYAGYTLQELYRDSAKTIFTQEKARGIILDRFGLDIGQPRIYMPTFLSVEMYKEFIVPCYDKIISHFHCPSLYLHSEELHPGHLRHLQHLPLTCLDLGWERDTFLDVEIVKNESEFNFSWNFNYMKDLVEGNPESIKKLYEQVLKRGGDRLVRIKAGIPRGTPPENVSALIQVAKAYA